MRFSGQIAMKTRMDIALSPAPLFHLRRRGALLALVVFAHLLVIGGLSHLRHAQPAALQPPRLVAWLLAPESPPAAAPATPHVALAQRTAPRNPHVHSTQQPGQAPQTRRVDLHALAAESAPPPAPAVVQESAPAAIALPAAANTEPAAPPLTTPRFDLAYLNNPPPAYPAASRRAGEQGKALLRVLVGVAGEVLRIELAQSSGFVRLDQAALDAVRNWRFVPARLGEQAVQAWAVVPLNFRLNT
jgi:protein TonB